MGLLSAHRTCCCRARNIQRMCFLLVYLRFPLDNASIALSYLAITECHVWRSPIHPQLQSHLLHIHHRHNLGLRHPLCQMAPPWLSCETICLFFSWSTVPDNFLEKNAKYLDWALPSATVASHYLHSLLTIVGLCLDFHLMRNDDLIRIYQRYDCYFHCSCSVCHHLYERRWRLHRPAARWKTDPRRTLRDVTTNFAIFLKYLLPSIFYF